MSIRASIAAVLFVGCGGGQDAAPPRPPAPPADPGPECCCGYQMESTDPEDDDGLEWFYQDAPPTACEQQLQGTCTDDVRCRMGLV